MLGLQVQSSGLPLGSRKDTQGLVCLCLFIVYSLLGGSFLSQVPGLWV